MEAFTPTTLESNEKASCYEKVGTEGLGIGLGTAKQSSVTLDTMRDDCRGDCSSNILTNRLSITSRPSTQNANAAPSARWGINESVKDDVWSRHYLLDPRHGTELIEDLDRSWM